ADVAGGRGRIDGPEAVQAEGEPRAVFLFPIGRRLPALLLDRRPAVHQPEGRRRVAAVPDELDPLAVRHERTANLDGFDQGAVRGRLVVKMEAVALVADEMDAGGQRHIVMRAAAL